MVGGDAGGGRSHRIERRVAGQVHRDQQRGAVRGRPAGADLEHAGQLPEAGPHIGGGGLRSGEVERAAGRWP